MPIVAIVMESTAVLCVHQAFEEMQSKYGLTPNRFCYCAVIKALANGGQGKRALDRLAEMEERRLAADPVVYTAAIAACEKVRKQQADDQRRALGSRLAGRCSEGALCVLPTMVL